MKKLFVVMFLFVAVNIFAQEIYTEQDSIICNQKFELAIKDSLNKLPIGKVIDAVGKSFIGTPYVAHSLEKGDTEQLVINFTGLDCTTFLETVLTLSRCIKKNKTTFEDYKNELKFIRYRDGKLNGYASRLHYTSDWILNNQKKGVVKSMAKEIGGILYDRKVFFMSKNPDKYEILSKNPQFLPLITESENYVNSNEKYYIPKDKITSVENKISTGDLIGITTTIEGIDISHVGIAVKGDDGHVYFMHAPMVGKHVTLTTEPLSSYLSKNSKSTGIYITRPLEVE